MRTRNHDWFDTSTLTPWYGFQAFYEGEWVNAAEDGKPCLFLTEKERNDKRAEWRKLKEEFKKPIRLPAKRETP